MIALFSALLLLGAGSFGDGERAYREGRFAEALAAFREAERASGERAPAEILYNQALAALRAGELAEADAAAEKAAVRGGPDVAAQSAFVRGSAAFARCERAEREAALLDVRPTALDEAIAHAERARRFWLDAAATRDDWPEARRNVERALLKLEELRQRKAEERMKKASDAPPPSETQPFEPPSEDRREQVEDPSALEPQRVELSPEQVRLLLEKLEAKEKEKLALRRAHRRLRDAGVERDW
jgi:tetratricopeptide (TPR) repeat protein